MLWLFRGVWNAVLALFYFAKARPLYLPHIKQNPKNCEFVRSCCGNSVPALIWALVKGAFLYGADRDRVSPTAGRLKADDEAPLQCTLANLDGEQRTLEEFIAEAGVTPKTPVVLNFGSIT